MNSAPNDLPPPEKNWDSLPPLRDVISQNNLRAEKKFGQNFLLDMNLTDKIARAAGNISSHTVFEIGPGPGGLTRSILKAGTQKLIAIELDPRAIEALSGLADFAGQDKLTILHDDALKADLTDLAPQPPRAIIANLPYNVATPLLIKWLRQIYENPDNFSVMILMFQKEVAERITAKPNSKAYGRLSILAQWLCDADIVFDLPPSAFTPPPKVTSSVVRFTPKPRQKDWPPFDMVEKITAAAFGQRRKMLRKSLGNHLEAMEKAGIDPTRRAETLCPQEILEIARRAVSA